MLRHNLKDLHKHETQRERLMMSKIRWKTGREEDGMFKWELIRKNGRSAATVYENGNWFTWDENGFGGENDSQDCVTNAKMAALLSSLNQGFLP